MSLVLTAKVRRVVVADAKTGAGGIEVLAEHQPPRFLETQLFEKLQGAHRRDRFEMMMKSGNAHPQITGQTFHPQRLVKMRAKVLDCLRDASAFATRDDMG